MDKDVQGTLDELEHFLGKANCMKHTHRFVNKDQQFPLDDMSSLPDTDEGMQGSIVEIREDTSISDDHVTLEEEDDEINPFDDLINMRNILGPATDSVDAMSIPVAASLTDIF